MFVAEFQAIVLGAGRSCPLEELTATSKCLLPVGNLPLIYYPLLWLKKNGFDGCIVVVYESTKFDVSHALQPLLDPTFNVEYLSIVDDDDWGTADVLRDLHKKQKIKRDMLVVSCDVFTEIPLQEIANVFRVHDASVTGVFQKKQTPAAPILPGTKSKKLIDREFVGIDPDTSRLVFSASQADIHSTINLQQLLLTRYPRLKIHGGLEDGHIYLLKHWILELLAVETRLSSIRTDLIPFLIKKQHRSGHPTQLPHQPQSTPNSRQLDQSTISGAERLEDMSTEDELEVMARNLSTWTDHQGDMAEAYFGNSIRCYAHLLTDANQLSFRVNSLAAFCEANRQVSNVIVSKGLSASVKLGEKATVGSESVVGEGCVLGERVSVKKSVIGGNCRIGDKTKIGGCVIMEGVTIDDNCNIQNSVICSGAVVGEKSEIKDCLIGSHFEVAPGSKLTNETLTDSERLIEY